MQGLPIELGGFKGRTNKLVDGCYSWWVGGCVILVETLLGISEPHETPNNVHPEEESRGGETKSWDDADGERFSACVSFPAFSALICIGFFPLCMTTGDGCASV